MELLCQLDARATSDFFTTFFKLPASYWRGFLASKLSSGAWWRGAPATPAFLVGRMGVPLRVGTHLMAAALPQPSALAFAWCPHICSAQCQLA